MILVRLFLRIVILLLILVVAFFGLSIIDELFFEHKYLYLIIPGAFLTMLVFIPVIARLRLGKR